MRARGQNGGWRRARLVLFWTTVLCWTIAGAGSAATFTVPDEFPTISDAVGAASAGDTILVTPRPEPYPTQATIDRSLTIMSSDGNPETTILTGENAHRIFADVVQGIDLVVKGLTFDEGRTQSNFGGAVTLRRDATILFEDCVFRNCFGNSGGAINSWADLTIRNCLFEDNRANGNGGAIYAPGVFGTERITIENSTFRRNQGILGGALNLATDQPKIVRDCLFEGNLSRNLHGAGGSMSGDGELLVEGCDFIENDSYRGGGGLHIETIQGGVTIRDCFFKGNICQEIGNGGGALWMHDNASTLGVTIEDCTFVLNTAPLGSVAFVRAEGPAGPRFPQFERCILAYNTGSIFTCGDVQFGPASVGIDCSIRFGNVPDNSLCADHQGETVLLIDPFFCDLVDFLLCDNSPALTDPCGEMGGRDIGCTDCAVPTRSTSWGRMKGFFLPGSER